MARESVRDGGGLTAAVTGRWRGGGTAAAALTAYDGRDAGNRRPALEQPAADV
ncbi:MULTISPECIES: hypothetical protein [Streptomyces]|uniref:hypothetical protein n=1 Tax=Streptomyces TaxID=1883 RepID=UPI00131B9DFB|nr:hypothetical protein [Streptomyces sp. NRRL S-4]